MKLLGLGEFDLDAVFRVDGDGLALYANVAISGGFGGDIGLNFDVSATLELGIISNPKVLTTADGDTVTIDPGFRLTHAGLGHLPGLCRGLGLASPSPSCRIGSPSSST